MFTGAKVIVSLLLLAVIIQPVSVVAESMAGRQKRLIEGAKKEGEVVVWHISPLKKKEVLQPFMAKYPFINVKHWRSPGYGIVNKAIEEAKAGVPSHDLTILAGGETSSLLAAGILAQDAWPNTKGWVNQPDHNFYRAIVAGARVPVFNSKVVPESDWPKTWGDLIDPKWRGKAIVTVSAR